MDSSIETVEVTDFTSFANEVDELYDEWGREPWWRGQRLATWNLVPKVFRTPMYQNQEAHMAISFALRARAVLPCCPASADRAEWLFLMQHYGLPTRLLDWSASPMIAAYFATEAAVGEVEGADACVWALQPGELNAAFFGMQHRGVFVPNADVLRPLLRDAFAEPPARGPLVGAVAPPHIDARVAAQQSAFTVHASGARLDGQPKAAGCLRRFVIRGHARRNICHSLSHMGIKRSAIFPDAVHLAEEIASSLYSVAM